MPSDKFAIVCKAPGVAELTLYDVIDRWYGISADAIYQALKDMGDVKEIKVRINSPGGSVFEGTAIYNLLRQHSARKVVSVDGVAASMASIVAMAGDEIEMGDGAYLMIHDPVGAVRGDSQEMRDMADLLDKMRSQLVGIYSRKTGQSEDQIRTWMKDETWMTAAEAIQNRFANRTVPSLKIAAMAPVDFFARAPEALRARPKGERAMAEENTQPKAATYAELKAACVGADAAFLCSQLESGTTAEAAARAWMGELQKRLDAEAKAKGDAIKAADEAKAEADKAKAKKPGVEMLGGGKADATDGGADPVAAWNSAVEAKMRLNMTKGDAVRAMTAENPELHKSYIQAFNARVRGRR